VPRRFLFLSACAALLLSACIADEESRFIEGGEGEAEGDDPCDEEGKGDRRYGIMPGTCPGTSTPCADPQAPTGCNVRPGALTCTSPPGAATVLEVCGGGACPYTTITDAVAAIPADPGTEHWVVVHGGTYTENVTVTQTSGASDPITIAARCVGGSRDSVTVAHATDNPVLKVAATSANVTLEGFRVLASAVAATEGAVTLLGANGAVRDVVVSGADMHAAFYVQGSDCVLEEVDASDCRYGLQAFFADDVDLERGAFCDSLENGIQIDGGSGFRANATLVQDSAVVGVHVDVATDVRFTRLLTRGHTASGGGFGIELWDVNGFDLWHSQVTDNTFGILIDLDARDMELENVLLSRHTNGRAIEVNTGYIGNDQLRIRFSTFADGQYAIRLLAPIDVRLDRNIFYAGSAPGGYGIEITDASASLSAWDGSADPLENLFYGNYGVNQQCIEAVAGQCTNVMAFTSDAFMLGDGYYLEEDRSAAVNAASDNANTVTLGDGTDLDDYTTSLDLGLDAVQADLGFHHPPCFETFGDEGCGDGYCAGGETSGTCARDCP